MPSTEDQMATQPSLRIGDRERDAVAAELQEHFAHGRLTIEEFNERLDAVFAAKTQSDLSRIISDLPHARSAGAPLPSSRSAGRAQLVSRPGDAPSSGWAGYDWSGGDWSGRARRPRRHRLAALATLLAALASWLIVMDYFTTSLRFPLPGRIGLLIGIFAIIRGLLRRVFGIGRSSGRCGRARRPW
jgi:Domain of unknown function (DUF1707)